MPHRSHGETEAQGEEKLAPFMPLSHSLCICHLCFSFSGYIISGRCYIGPGVGGTCLWD